MPRTEISEEVRENRETITRVNAEFVEAPQSPRSQINSDGHVIRMTFDSAEVYERDIGDGLISGHPNGDRHGSGAGVSGDTRGAWSERTVNATGIIVLNGRRVGADAWAAEDAYIDTGVVGTGSTDVSRSDSSLAAETADATAHAIRDADDTTRVRVNYNVGDAPTIREAGFESNDDRLCARILLDADESYTNEQEARVDTTFSAEGTARGTATITAVGVAAYMDALARVSSDGALREIEIANSGDTTTARKFGVREAVGTEPSISTVFFSNEPTQDIDVANLRVYSEDGREVWNASPSVTKEQGDTLRVAVGFEVR